MSLADWRQRREDKAKPKPLPVIGGPRDGDMHPVETKDGNPAKPPSSKGQQGRYVRKTGAWRWVTPTSATNPVTDITASVKLPSHPTPPVLAKHGRNVSDRIQAEATQAIRLASVYAARGLPRSTGGGVHGANDSTSTERAAGVAGEDERTNGVVLTPPDPKLVGIDYRLAKAQRALWLAGLEVLELLDLIASHASDEDPIPAGTGSCRRCNAFCRPTAEKPNNRIMTGYCPTCHRAWHRAGKPDKAQFDKTYRTEAA